MSSILDGKFNQLHSKYLYEKYYGLEDLHYYASWLRAVKNEFYGKYPEYGTFKNVYNSGYYIPSLSENIVDQWGGELRLGQFVMLYSSGPDGRLGTSDDIGIPIESDYILKRFNSSDKDAIGKDCFEIIY